MIKQMLLTGSCIASLFLPAFSQQEHRKPLPSDSMPVIHLKSEPKFYVSVHSGYSLALGSTFKFYPDDVSAITVNKVDNSPATTQTTYKATTRGLGEGARAGAGFSWIANDFINIGLDVDYSSSTISKARDSSFHQTFTSGAVSQTNYSERLTISYKAILLTFTPNITFKAISRPKWFLYNRIGAIITIRPNSIEHDITDVAAHTQGQGISKDSASHTDMRLDWGIKNPSIGFMGAIGAQVKLTEKIRAFAEIQFSHVVFVVRKRTITSFDVNGKEMVNTIPDNEREINFQKDYSTGSASNPNQPGQAVTQRLPITYVGLQAGLSYRF